MKELFIKSIDCIIPGYNDPELGELISTEEILSNYKDLDNISLSKKDFDISFVKNSLGIESVSFSKCNAEFSKKFWYSKTRSSISELFSASKSTPNSSLFNALEKSIKNCLIDLDEKETDFGKKNIVAHVHISSFLFTYMGYELARIRKSLGISLENPLHTIFFQLGCSGILTALEYVKVILAGYPDGSNVLITADNNMLIHAHQRCNRDARADNMNDWLFNTIFGDGVGALIVGTNNYIENKPQSKSLFFSIDHFEKEIIENDWRVNYNLSPENRTSSIVIKAKEVKDTYIKGIGKFTTKAIEKSAGLDPLYKVCLHESNPKMIKLMQNNLNIPENMIPTISKHVGTLACVSSFSLLNMAFKEYTNDFKLNKNERNKSKFALSVIGESGGDVTAGNICFSAKEN